MLLQTPGLHRTLARTSVWGLCLLSVLYRFLWMYYSVFSPESHALIFMGISEFPVACVRCDGITLDLCLPDALLVLG